VVQGYEQNGLPLDTIWTDIDYMVDYEDFTIDENRFPLDRLNAILQKYRYIPIIDAGIKTSGPAYEEGLKRGVYVRESNTEKPFVGSVWPGDTTFVDFFHPNATQYWQDMLDRLYAKVKFSGVWLDMNEYANFCDGACKPPSAAYSYDYSRDLPYQPGDDNIESHTISLNATHYGNVTEANVHVYSGFLETYATNQFLKSKSLRPFIITRSSTWGSSKYGFHWTGDNKAEWEYLRSSIPDNFNNQMFGFQMVGPDICGFGGNTNTELCARWFQLGALYTFARNHNDADSISQEPYALGDTVLQAAKNNLKLRYSLLKYFYLQFLNKRGLGSIWRPLFFEFPLDANTYLDEIADTQFLVGPNVLVTPILEPGQTSRKIYLPQTNWYYFHSGVKFGPGTHLLENVGLTDLVPIFVREGFVMISQDTTDVVNTRQLNNVFTFLSGMRYDTRRSNATTKVYESAGTMLSIKDYHDDALVDRCLREGCEYVVNLIARLSAAERTLEIDFAYLGGARLNQQVFVEEIHLGLDTEIIVISLEKHIEVNGPHRVTIPIPLACPEPRPAANLNVNIITN
jgi:alpha-glucosidase/lysosomal alpha-glucosidase